MSLNKLSIGGKSQFRSFVAIERIKPEHKQYVQNVESVKSGKIDEPVQVAVIPKEVAGVEKQLLLQKVVVDKVSPQHNNFPSENFVITANNPSQIAILNDGNKINLIKQFGEKNFFVIGANKSNGYYTVTFFEPERSNYVKNSILGKTERVLDFTGGAFSSFATSPFGAASQLASPQKRFPGVRKSKDNIAQKSRIVKQTKKSSKKGGETLNPQKYRRF